MKQLMGGKNNQQHSSGLGGLAQSFLGGSKPQSNQGHNSGGIGGMAGQLAQSLLGGSKPHSNQTQAQNQGSGGGGMAGQFLGNLLGGNHSQGQQSSHNQQSTSSYGSSTNTGGGANTQHQQSGGGLLGLLSGNHGSSVRKRAVFSPDDIMLTKPRNRTISATTRRASPAAEATVAKHHRPLTSHLAR